MQCVSGFVEEVGDVSVRLSEVVMGTQARKARSPETCAKRQTATVETIAEKAQIELKEHGTQVVKLKKTHYDLEKQIRLAAFCQPFTVSLYLFQINIYDAFKK